MADVSYGLLLPTREVALGHGSVSELVALAAEAERLGYDSVWTGESLSAPRYEPLAVLAAAAAVTDTIHLGTAALLPAAREPVVTAAALATVDAMSDGRLIVGVGAGFPGLSRQSFTATGHTYGDRYERLEDTVAFWRHLWRGDTRPFAGSVLHVDEPPALAPPASKDGPPIWFAGDTPAGRSRTGEAYDGWLPYPPDPDDYARGLAEVRAAGGDDVTPAIYLTATIDDDPDRAEAALAEWCAVFYGRPLEFVRSIQVLVAGTPDEVGAGIDRYLAAGCRHVVVRIGSLDRAEQLHRLTELRLTELRLTERVGR
jgi:alkanesulfonate monooxygenase SsuD/methylene tetrahydromethanopterin reductase-like flavin-dependent oxidoreductase (luciferase family)